MISLPRRALAGLAVLTLVAAACGSDDEPAPSEDTAAAEGTAAVDDGVPTIVVTTNVLGDVVEEVVGDQANVVTIMPVGVDPHDFQASAQEVDQVVNADALVTNGADFEEGLTDVIDNARAEGVPIYEAIESVDTIEFGHGGHDEHGDEHSDEHSDEGDSDDQHGDEHSDGGDSDDEHSDEHDHEGVDPHFFTDPMRMADAVEGLVEFLTAEVDIIGEAALEEPAAAFVAELEALDVEVMSLVDSIPAERRVLVTNHEVFGYFADRYGFEIVGVVIPGGSTTDSASAGELAELADVIRDEGVPAIFADAASPDELIAVLADEVGDVAVVELYSESLGESGSDGETYLDMVRSNAERISAALA